MRGVLESEAAFEVGEARAPVWRRLQGLWNDLLGNHAADAFLEASQRKAASPAVLVLVFLAAIGLVTLTAALREDSPAALSLLLCGAVAAEIVSQYIERRRSPMLWLIQLKIAFFAFTIGAALWVCLGASDPSIYGGHQIVFLIYLLLITAAGLRDAPLLPLGAGITALTSYAAVSAAVPALARASSPARAELLRLDFDATQVTGHAAMLVCITVMAVASARRGQAVRRLSVRDGLTGLLNRQVFDTCLDAESERARRSGRPLSVAMIDVDFFKSLNDTFGHAFGDEVLRWVARLLRETFRASDLVARYGGEEFVVVFVDSEGDRLVERLDALRARIAATPLQPTPDAEPVRVTVSVGIASWPADGDEVRGVLAVADERLYLAKGEGRNRVIAASPPATLD